MAKLEIQIFPVYLFFYSCSIYSAGRAAIWSIKATVIHSNTVMSVFLVWLRRLAWLFACVVTLYFKQGRGRKPQKPQSLPSSFFHYYDSQGDEKSLLNTTSWVTLVLSPTSLRGNVFLTTEPFIKSHLFSIQSISLLCRMNVWRNIFVQKVQIILTQ